MWHAWALHLARYMESRAGKHKQRGGAPVARMSEKGAHGLCVGHGRSLVHSIFDCERTAAPRGCQAWVCGVVVVV
eukprot:scaffold1411_cov125-Isochrysis_galbana.AAC.8